MSECRICPRNCGVDRSLGQKGYCGENHRIRVARAALHMWEEPCISGEKGSGTVFFSGCPLKCVFCQNGIIANSNAGKEISAEKLAEVYIRLQSEGANNINLVTGTHFIPQIAKSLELAKGHGLDIPVVYNTGGYESVDSIRRLEGLVDVYLPDMKYCDEMLSKRYSNAKNYFKVAKKALNEMFLQVKEPCFAGDGENIEKGIMKKGMLVRHLVLPGQIEDSKKVIRYLHDTYGNDIFISIMNQYTPMKGIENKYPELGRKLTEAEYDEVVDFAIEIGVENGFIQEGETAKESFIPAFDGEGL